MIDVTLVDDTDPINQKMMDFIAPIVDHAPGSLAIKEKLTTLRVRLEDVMRI